MAINSKDPDTDRLARELAERTGETLTAAVSTAIAERLDLLLHRADVRLVPVDERRAEPARAARRRFGRGRHPARLDHGHCCSHALAVDRHEPLPFEGDDSPRRTSASRARDRRRAEQHAGPLLADPAPAAGRPTAPAGSPRPRPFVASLAAPPSTDVRSLRPPPTMLPLLAGLLLIFVVSCVKVVRVARAANVPSAVRLGAVTTWMVGTLAVAVLPAFAALAILDAVTGFVRFSDGGIDQLAAATLWVGLCDAANIGRLVAPRDEDRGGAADLTRDRRLLFVASAIATIAYAAALLIAVGFVDHGHVAVGVAIVLGFLASAGTVQARPGGPGMGPLTRRPVDPKDTVGAGTHSDPDAADGSDTTPAGDARDPRDAGATGAGREPDGDRRGRRR